MTQPLGSYTIHWLIPQRVIYVRVMGHHTADTARSYGAKMLATLEQGTPPVHLILDDSQLVSVPTSLSTMQDALSFSRHEALGWVVNVGHARRIIRLGGEFMAKVLGVKYHRVGTFDEAVNFLKSQDASLDWDALVPPDDQKKNGIH